MSKPEAPSVITPDRFAAVGRALYGDQWQAPLARALEISDRTVRRFLAGDYPIHAGIVADLADLCAARGAVLMTMAEELGKAG